LFEYSRPRAVQFEHLALVIDNDRRTHNLGLLMSVNTLVDSPAGSTTRAAIAAHG
jgi:hypothetical protein